MIHFFESSIAEKYGIASAIILQNIYYWIEKNRANNINFKNDAYWTYNSKKAFKELFPYLSERQIDYAIKNLINEGLIITGNFNQDGRDRTIWYSITKKGYCILQNDGMHFTKVRDCILQNDGTITKYKQTNIKENNNINIISKEKNIILSKTERDNINTAYKLLGKK